MLCLYVSLQSYTLVRVTHILACDMRELTVRRLRLVT